MWDQAGFLAAMNNSPSRRHPMEIGSWIPTPPLTCWVIMVFFHTPLPFIPLSWSAMALTFLSPTLVPPTSLCPHLLWFSTMFLLHPYTVKNLISIGQFTHDNFGLIEFDLFGFFVNDLRTKKEILHSSSVGDLYPFRSTAIAVPPQAFLSVVASTELWHCRLGHPGL